MNEGQRAALKRYHQRLAEDIIVSEDLLGELYQVGIFEKGMIDMIRAERASDQVHKLLVLLPKRGPEAFERFVAVIERDYPWLATALLSAPTKTAAPATESLTHSRHTALGHHSKPLSSSTPALQDGVDGDIKKLVAAFIHRQFGQSKRISEKDKKSLEKFVNGQIQRERTRYQSMLNSTTCSSPCSEMESSQDNVFHSTDVQDSLFSIHMKMEPHILDKNTTIGNNNSNSNNNNNNMNDVDRADHPDAAPYSFSQYHSVHSKKLMPEDMDFALIGREVEDLIRQLERLSAQMIDCLEHFDPSLHQRPLTVLIGNLVDQCERQREEMHVDSQRITQMLNEIDRYSSHIERLEKERAEHRKQIQAAYQDMGTLRQEKTALTERCQKLERDIQRFTSEGQKGRDVLKLGIVSKAAKTTPRGPYPGGNNAAASSSSSYGQGLGLGNMNFDDPQGHGQGQGQGQVSSSYARRATVRTAQGRAVTTYTGYPRRYPSGVRYSFNTAKKKAVAKDGVVASSNKF